jgi:serine/threonine protein kinase
MGMATRAAETGYPAQMEQLLPGAEVERYVVISRVGAGRMTTMYSVKHTVLDTRHVLSVPNVPLKGLVRRLLAGAKIQARLRHPGVVAVTDVLDLDGLPALVLDHVPGPRLDQLIRFHELDEARIDNVAAGLCEAVAFLHANSVVHRHLKPKNIMVDMSGKADVPRIGDFTLAKRTGHTPPTKSRKKPRIFGTAAYMSPEQTVDSDRVGHQSDLWSLGCILYHLATGVEAFESPSADEAFELVRVGRYLPVKRRNASAPTRWARAVAAALMVDEKDRVRSAEELHDIWFDGVDARPEVESRAAPVGRVTLVFTDIQGSTRLWESHEDVMRHSLRAHDAVMRTALRKHGGYEVKTEGDAFMVAFPQPSQGIRFCLEVQRKLHDHPWSEELLTTPEAGVIPGFRGLRVRMGIHVGEPEARRHGEKTDYYGPMVNRAARIGGCGHGGQILVSAECWAVGRLADEEIIATDMGEFSLRSLAGTQRLVQLVPAELAQRCFAPVKAEWVGD